MIFVFKYCTGCCEIQTLEQCFSIGGGSGGDFAF